MPKPGTMGLIVDLVKAEGVTAAYAGLSASLMRSVNHPCQLSAQRSVLKLRDGLRWGQRS
jgi:hypothetical protein